MFVCVLFCCFEQYHIVTYITNNLYETILAAGSKESEKCEPAFLETSVFPCSLQMISNKFCTAS